NLVALTEGSIKRMLAYSSIAHAGYLLVALLANSGEGVAAFLFYLLVYTLMTAGAFAILVANSRENGEERVALEDWQGFAAEKPWLAGLFSVFLLSLAGFPLTAGFLGKLYILRAAVGAGLPWLAVVLVLASLVSYFYYLRVVVVMYMRPVRVPGEHAAAGLPGPARLAAGVAAALVVLLFFLGGFPPLRRPFNWVAGPLVWAEWAGADFFASGTNVLPPPTAAATAETAPLP
ncbi:MAG TPA: proton-conducting transporter membrane subunit, partial [Longimicrobiaceae bacterium]|nr:proton-conducting transporter membrane subunit [Longimicrobiaceae bacterium]